MKTPKASALARGAKWYAPRFLSLALALGGVTFFMYYSDLMSRALIGFLKPEVDPAFTGGEIAGVYYDPLGDDYGAGGLVYPLNRAFLPGSLDLVRYAVRAPVWGARWQGTSEYWQLDLSFASGPAETRAVRIYLDMDGDGKGAAEIPEGSPEGVALDPAHPWDWRIALDGLAGTISSADGKTVLKAEVTALDGGKNLRVRLPLDRPELRPIFGAEKTWQYVLVSAWAPWSRGAVMPAAKRASSDRAGGASSPFVPAVFDLLSEEPGSQENQLSSWDETSLTMASVAPVEISLLSRRGTGGRQADDSGIATLRALAEEAVSKDRDAERDQAAAEEAWSALRGTPLPEDIPALASYAVTAFNAGDRKTAEIAFDALLAFNPDDSPALAYKGALLAQKGGDAPPLAAVAIIADAYACLDRAIDLAHTGGNADSIITARLCRGNVSLAVPEAVFGKRAQGAEDFLEAARAGLAAGGEGSGAFAAECYLKAGICLEDAGRADEAGTWFREALRLAGQAETGE